jgi:hypothetical protein
MRQRPVIPKLNWLALGSPFSSQANSMPFSAPKSNCPVPYHLPEKRCMKSAASSAQAGVAVEPNRSAAQRTSEVRRNIGNSVMSGFEATVENQA